jgi:Fe-Mn family superoxide dismutase
MAFTLPDLPYAANALEPHIDERTMQIHHGKHHAAYVANLNKALEGHDFLQSRTIAQILADIEAVPEEIRTAVRNNGGGHANHSLFWTIMSPDGGGEPAGKLAEAIGSKFGGFDAFKEKFATAAGTRFGSGWAWLTVDNHNDLQLYSTANQDSPYMKEEIPILGLDVWEHAYYLHYQNRRPDYVSAFWNVVNWAEVGRLYEEALD